MGVIYKKNDHIQDETAIAYICDELDVYQKFMIREHIQTCPECLKKFKQWQDFYASYRRIMSPADQERARIHKVRFLYLDEISELVKKNLTRPYRVGFLVEGGLFYQNQYFVELQKAIQEKVGYTPERYNFVSILRNDMELLVGGQTPIVISSSGKVWSNVRADVLSHKEYIIPLSDGDRKELQRQAERCYIALSDNSDIWNPLEWAVLFGAFGVLTPLSILEQLTKISAGSLQDRLHSAKPVLIPFQSDQQTTLDKADSIAIKSDIIAESILEILEWWDTKALTEKLDSALGGILIAGGNSFTDRSTDFIFRLLHSLVLNNQRKAALSIMQHQHEYLQAIQNGITDVCHIHAWAKIYRKLDHPFGDNRAQQLYNLGLDLDIEGNNIYLLNSYATFLADRGNYPNAARYFRKIENLGKSDNIYTLVAWADMLLKQAIHIEDARIKLERACELEPGNPYPLQMLGLLEQKKVYFTSIQRAEDFQQGLDNSERRLLEALDIDAGNVPTLHALGHLMRERGQFKDAEKWLINAFEHDPDNALILVELGRLFTESVSRDKDEAYEEANLFFNRALTLDEDNIFARTALADLDIKIGRFEEAEHNLRIAEKTARERNESTAAIETTRIKLEMKRGLANEQTVFKLQGLSRDHDPAVRIIANNLLVKVYWAIGNKRLAEQTFYRIIRDNVTPHTINNYAGLLARNASNPEIFSQAHEWYEISLRHDSRNAHTYMGLGINLLNWAEVDSDTAKKQRGKQAISYARSLGLDISIAIAQQEE